MGGRQLCRTSAAWQQPFRDAAWVCGLVGLALAWAAAASYVAPARNALRTGRTARAAAGTARGAGTARTAGAGDTSGTAGTADRSAV